MHASYKIDLKQVLKVNLRGNTFERECINLNNFFVCLSKICPWAINLSGCSKRGIGVFLSISPKVRPPCTHTVSLAIDNIGPYGAILSMVGLILQQRYFVMV